MQVEGPLRHHFVSSETGNGNGNGNGISGGTTTTATPNNSSSRSNNNSKIGTENTRYKLKGTFQTTSDIVRTEGWRGLYRGWAVGLGKTAPASMVTVCVYEWVLYRLMGRMDQG